MKKIINQNYFYGNLGNPHATQSVIDVLPSFDLMAAGVGYMGMSGNMDDDLDDLIDPDIRKCRVDHIGEGGLITKGLEELIIGANKLAWKKDLKGKWDNGCVDYLLYDKPQDRFRWHKDTYPGDDYEPYRVLSISYCLSHASEYEGAEFCIGDQRMKMDFGDFVVFPSGTYHCVRPLTSGRRAVLVGWYH